MKTDIPVMKADAPRMKTAIMLVSEALSLIHISEPTRH